MEEETDGIIGEVRLTDSQKSVATSNVYSMEFTECSSDRNNSSGKDTYVIEQDDTESTDSYPHEELTVIQQDNKEANVQCIVNTVSRAASTSTFRCQEIYTQTSKTIIELAKVDCTKNLETQTSYVSITENRSYKIEMMKQSMEHNAVSASTGALDDQSSKLYFSDSDTFDENNNESDSDDRIINILDSESKDNIPSDDNLCSPLNQMSEFEDDYNSDDSVEPDSLMEIKNGSIKENGSHSPSIPKSIDEEIEDLYNKLTESKETNAKYRDDENKRLRVLTPLTEESTVYTINKEKLSDATSKYQNMKIHDDERENEVLFTNFAGGNIKILSKEENREFKLPPIRNNFCPNSPQLNFLFSVNPTSQLVKVRNLPCLYETAERSGLDCCQMETKNLASGESTFLSGRNDLIRNNGSIHLPPIQLDGFVVESRISKAQPFTNSLVEDTVGDHPQKPKESISIKDKIRDLKMSKSARSRVQSSTTESRSCSPSSVESPSKLCEVAERGCDVLSTELLRRLRSSAWYDVSETLEEIPAALEKFWQVMPENRVADLIRQVCAQVESPRTQVARAACNCLAAILKNTKYTKKPEFNEAMSLLLTKTGSFSRAVRRAANLALDAAVCAVDLTHAVTALAVHGAQHKSGAVRGAAARLLVVRCAVGGGGRALLRRRPPSAAAARRLTLRALADLLTDSHAEARRYAERLYAMLRPLPNFEAYYLTDVDVERATRQMKKYDRALRTNAVEER